MLEPQDALVSVVVPCYNEQGNIESLIQEAREVVTRRPNIEFIFVDNGSTDGTRGLLEALTYSAAGLKVAVVDRNQGYGFGIRSGLKATTGKFVGWTHADRQTKLTDIEVAIEILTKNQERIFLKGLRAGRPLSDHIFTLGMSLFESILFRTKLSDINAQPTLFARELLHEVLEGPDDFSLDLYAYVVAKRFGMKVLRIPVTFGPRFSGESKWNTSARARWKFISRTLAFSFRLALSTKGTS
jgi:glycosyltransferase involved in cell wall biosynthesis